MKTKINLHTSDVAELMICRNYSDSITTLDNDSKEWDFHLNNTIGNGVYKESFYGDIRVGYGNIALAQKTLLDYESDFETIEMHFLLNGYKTTHCKDLSRSAYFSPNQHNIFYLNNTKGQIEFQENDIWLFEVNMSPGFFKRYLPEESLIFEVFREKINGGCSSLIDEQNRPITPKMLQIIQEIILCERQGLFKKMFIEAKVIELLLLQLEQLIEKDFVNTTLKKSDIEKMYAVKDFILNNLTYPCSLIDLAQKVGTNEFTLKKGFKELFGTTVFGFWNDVKMEEARKMLQTKELNVSEVAYQIGYKHPQHFATAFKRRFGISPSELIH